MVVDGGESGLNDITVPLDASVSMVHVLTAKESVRLLTHGSPEDSWNCVGDGKTRTQVFMI